MNDLLRHYSLALDEIYRLRGLLAYEAVVTAAHLELKTFPKSRRVSAELQVQRMTAAATGNSADICAGVSRQEMQAVRKHLGIELLTRAMFEREAAR